MDFFATNSSMQFMTVFALVDLVWLVSVVARKRSYVPVEAECVRVFAVGGWGTCSQWLLEFEGQRRVVPKKLDGCCDKGKRQVGDRAIVYVNPRNVDRSLTPQIDGDFKLLGLMSLGGAVSLIVMPLL